MKKSVMNLFLKLTLSAVTLMSALIPQASGQPQNRDCDVPSADVLGGSHILCFPYRDLNPFSSLPGEINQWGTGTVYLNTGDSATGRYLVYNAIGSNLLTVKYGTATIFVADKSTIKGFTFRSEKRKDKWLTYEYFPMSNWFFSDGEGAFLEVLVKDTASLYHLASIEKFPMSDNLKGHSYYFVRQSSGDLKRVFPNRKSLCKALECPDDLRKQLRSVHSRGNRRERLVEWVREYNRYIRI